MLEHSLHHSARKYTPPRIWVRASERRTLAGVGIARVCVALKRPLLCMYVLLWLII